MELCWLEQPCHSLPPWQGAEEPFFSKNCLLIPDVSVAYSTGRMCFWACWDKAAGGCLAFHPSMPPSARKWSGGPRRVPRWDIASLRSQTSGQRADLALWSREEVTLSCCFSSGVVSLHGRSGAGGWALLSSFWSESKKWNGRCKYCLRNGCEKGQFLSPCYWDIFALLCQGCGLGGWGAAARGTAVLCCCALPFPVLDGPAICGAVLWNRIRKWSDQALQK